MRVECEGGNVCRYACMMSVCVEGVRMGMM